MSLSRMASGHTRWPRACEAFGAQPGERRVPCNRNVARELGFDLAFVVRVEKIVKREVVFGDRATRDRFDSIAWPADRGDIAFANAVVGRLRAAARLWIVQHSDQIAMTESGASYSEYYLMRRSPTCESIRDPAEDTDNRSPFTKSSSCPRRKICSRLIWGELALPSPSTVCLMCLL
jgi:hypothetical protein